jgi:L-lactate dehydrogenase complex protein LldF
MAESVNNFILESKNACENEYKKNILLKNLGHFYKKWNNGRSRFSDLETARKKIHYVKYKSIENLEKNIVEFEGKFNSFGGKVLYAPSKDDALSYILQILKENNVSKIIKSKSMVCEEIELEDFLKNHKISTLETDLGEFLVQLAGQKPSHITAPALHLSKLEICNLLNEKYEQDFSEETSPETIVRFVRNLLREEFAKADAGITGANFLIADQGSVSITENEANAVLCAISSRVHIIVAGIEKIISSVENLELFQTMLASHGTGQNITAYNHLFTGARKQRDGNTQTVVILLDNGRTSLMKDVLLRETSYCIKCGACHNFCPVFRQIGGHAYGTVYGGPIGSIVSPHIFGFKNFSHLPYASSLCGKCNEVCPSRLDLTSLLIQERKNIVSFSINLSSERKVFKKLHKLLLKRKRMDRWSAFIKSTGVKIFLRNNWGQNREIPKFSPQSFNKIKRKEK